MFLPVQPDRRAATSSRVKLATRHPNPVLVARAAPERAARRAGARSCRSTRRRRSGFAALPARARSRSRAATCSRRARASRGSSSDGPASAMLLLQRANLLAVRPARAERPARGRRARAVRQGARSATRARGTPALQLAGMMASNGRADRGDRRAARGVGALARGAGDPGSASPICCASRAGTPRPTPSSRSCASACPTRARRSSLELDALRERKRESRGRAGGRQADALRGAGQRALLAACCASGSGPTPSASSTGCRRSSRRRTRYPWLLARLELAKNRGDGAAIDRADRRAARALSALGQRARYEQIDRLAQGQRRRRRARRAARRTRRPSRPRWPSCTGSRRCSAAST